MAIGTGPATAILAIVQSVGILVRLLGHPPAVAGPQVLIEEFKMAAVCDICNKGHCFGKSVSHSHRRTSRRWNPNIQTVRAVDRPGGNKKRVNVCTSCIKAGKVARG
jgi:large subunit ribosomal protein L28